MLFKYVLLLLLDWFKPLRFTNATFPPDVISAASPGDVDSPWKAALNESPFTIEISNDIHSSHPTIDVSL